MALSKRFLTRFAVFFLFFALLLQFTPVTAWYAGWLSGNWTESDGDTLIILAAEMERPDVIGLSSYWRAIYAIRAWRAGHFTRVVVSGGTPNGLHQSLAAVIGNFLICNGIPKDQVVLEDASLSTHENAVFTTRIVRDWPGKKVLLTSDFHMFRARRAFEKAGLAVAPRPFPDVIKQSNAFWNREYCVGILAAETVKIAYYRWKGWI